VFAFVSGRPSLDLVGTLKWRRDDEEEQLVDASAWRAWVGASGLRVSLVGPIDGPALRRVIDVRESLYRALTAVLDGRTVPRADLARLNTVAAGSDPGMRLDARGNVRRAGTVDQVLTALVRDALDVLSGANRAKLRECVHPRCTRLFIDTSRAGTRRWCGMTECGNKAKVAAFRARRRACAPTEAVGATNTWTSKPRRG
jgi:predicted RNA-binding Zn ribbon-like protein